MSVLTRHTLLSLTILAVFILRYYQTIPAVILQPIKVSFQGKVEELPYVKNGRQYLTVSVTSNQSRTVLLPGDRLMVHANLYPQFQYGDLLKITGTLNSRRIVSYPDITPSGRSPNQLLQILYAIRARCESALERNLTADEAALAEGMLLGTNKQFSKDVDNAFQHTGTLHMIVVSGFNITMVSSSILRLAGVVHRKIAISLALVGIILFVLITGAQPPALRAGIMSGIVLLGQFTGRPNTSLRALGIASLTMLLISPQLLNSLSFQLSCLATLGLILGSPLFNKLLPQAHSSAIKYLEGETSTTLSAQIAVTPLLVHTFGNLSLIAPITNLAVSWLVPYIMLSTLSLCLADVIHPMLSKLVALVLETITAFFLHILLLFAKLPFSFFEGISTNMFEVLGFYALLAFVIIKLRDQEIYPITRDLKKEENE